MQGEKLGEEKRNQMKCFKVLKESRVGDGMMDKARGECFLTIFREEVVALAILGTREEWMFGREKVVKYERNLFFRL